MNIYGNIYGKSIEYWIKNTTETYDISYNGGYAVGFRFMAYLDSVYGNYKDWIFYYENKRPYHALTQLTNQQIELFKISVV
jgi:hypothetical protein